MSDDETAPAKQPKKAAKEKSTTTLTVDGIDVVVSSPEKLYFPALGITKLDVVNHYLAVKDAAVLALRDRPMILKRYLHGITQEPFFQKRVQSPPPFVDTAVFKYRSGGVAEEACVNNGAGLVWVANLGCIEMHVHPVRRDDLEHPDELRIDLDPGAGFGWDKVIDTAKAARAVLDDNGLVGWPKTSGSRGVHIWVRIQRTPEKRWTYDEVRTAAVVIAQQIEQRLPGVATTTWQKTERHGVLVDYNQNAKDRTTCGAWSVRANAFARVSMPLTWDELITCDPNAFTVKTVANIYAEKGDPHARIDENPADLTALLAKAPEMPKKKKATKKEPDKEAVITIATAEHKVDAEAGLAAWQLRHPAVTSLLQPDDVLIDSMRGLSAAWWRVRIHLRNVPREQRPAPEEPSPNWQPPAFDPSTWPEKLRKERGITDEVLAEIQAKVAKKKARAQAKKPAPNSSSSD